MMRDTVFGMRWEREREIANKRSTLKEDIDKTVIKMTKEEIFIQLESCLKLFKDIRYGELHGDTMKRYLEEKIIYLDKLIGK